MVTNSFQKLDSSSVSHSVLCDSSDSTKGSKPDAILLSAGMLGRRVFFPKALFEFKGKTLIEYQIEWLTPYVNKIIIACHKDEGELIKHFIGELDNVEFSLETHLLGTSGAIKKALEKTSSDRVIICNVDSLTDIDLNSLINFGTDTICVTNPRINYGLVSIDSIDGIHQFREKPILKDLWISCGVYLLSKKSMDNFPPRGSLEHDVFPYTKMRAFKHLGFFKHFEEMNCKDMM